VAKRELVLPRLQNDLLPERRAFGLDLDLAGARLGRVDGEGDLERLAGADPLG